jgi:sugar fermentation stimulation protein A
MELPTPILTGRLIRRRLRFLFDLRLDGGELSTVHCPNTGTMEGCLERGATVLASVGRGANRRTSHTAEWIHLAGGWVGINTLRSNAIVGEALAAGAVPELANYAELRSEVRYGRASRVDHLLAGRGLPDCYVEVKSATWPTPDGGVGFPDTVTERGCKHLAELRRVVRAGQRAVVFFLVNRQDGAFFRPAWERDAVYARALTRAARAGVEIIVHRVRLDLRRRTVSLGERLPCDLRPR